MTRLVWNFLKILLVLAIWERNRKYLPRNFLKSYCLANNQTFSYLQTKTKSLYLLGIPVNFILEANIPSKINILAFEKIHVITVRCFQFMNRNPEEGNFWSKRIDPDTKLQNKLSPDDFLYFNPAKIIDYK
ncbi:hypothetical protein BpHYR1_049139 [Brachionus plicatilis]|uniref:Uncharacterized protein n=1 Tax=Brachionus plicatilis TaxID=10195 RepID=A0A3M7SKI9_BRAPC|nr:hypothetical protein BpHYR1_049139 [Brachionus plicatilis]